MEKEELLDSKGRERTLMTRTRMREWRRRSSGRTRLGMVFLWGGGRREGGVKERKKKRSKRGLSLPCGQMHTSMGVV